MRHYRDYNRFRKPRPSSNFRKSSGGWGIQATTKPRPPNRRLGHGLNTQTRHGHGFNTQTRHEALAHWEEDQLPRRSSMIVCYDRVRFLSLGSGTRWTGIAFTRTFRLLRFKRRRWCASATASITQSSNLTDVTSADTDCTMLGFGGQMARARDGMCGYKRGELRRLEGCGDCEVNISVLFSRNSLSLTLSYHTAERSRARLQRGRSMRDVSQARRRGLRPRLAVLCLCDTSVCIHASSLISTHLMCV